MITFVKGKSNRLGLRVSSSVDIGGFSAVIAVCPTLKTTVDLTSRDCCFTFDAGDFPEVVVRPVLGTLVVLDAEGKPYQEFVVEFRVVEEAGYDTDMYNQYLYLTIASTNVPPTSIGATPSGDYVTQAQLSGAIKRCEGYTDEKIEDIGETIVETQPVHVVDAQGQPIEMTVQQATQSVVDMQVDIEEGKTTHTIASVKDIDHDGQPDGGVLYLNPSKPH